MIAFISSRLVVMAKALHGFKVTGIPLVERDLTGLSPIWGVDDVGIYYWASIIGSVFNVSAHQAAHYFLLSLIVAGGAVALLGFYFLIEKWWLKIFSALCVAYLMYRVFYCGDVYIVYFVTACFIPLCVVLFKKRYFKVTLFYFFIIGLAGAELGFVRSFAALHTFIFCCVALLTTGYFRWQQKYLLVFALMVGYGLGYFHPWYVLYQRDRFLKQHGIIGQSPSAHPLWHNFYAGFGFIPNEWNIQYEDSDVFARFEDLKKKRVCGTDSYELAVRNGVFEMIKKHPFFVGTVLAAKAGVLVFYFLLFGGFFFFLSLFFKREKQWDLPWITALIASGIPMMIAIPLFSFIPGFLAISFFYGLFLLNNIVNRYSFKEICQTVLSKSLTIVISFFQFEESKKL